MKVNKNNYYGTTGSIESLSYLEFGSIDLKRGSKKIWGYWQDQEAYDLYMFSRYARDLFAFRDFSESQDRDLSKLNDVVKHSAHDKLLDYVFKYAGIITACNDESEGFICESGSSLMGLIDECVALDHVFSEGNNKKKILAQSYVGSDISEIMNKGAAAFHPDVDLHFSTAPTIGELLKEISRFKLFYGLSVSMRYALRTAADLAQIGRQSELAIFNRLSLNFQETTSLIYGSGKYVYIVSLPELLELLQQYGITARYCEENMQRNKDGEHTVRASIIMAKDVKKLDAFIDNYNRCIQQSKEFTGIEKSIWKELRELEP